MKTKKDYTSSEYILSNFLGATTKYVIIVASLLIVSFPLYWLIISAFKLEQDYLAFPPILLPLRYTLNSFTEIFTRDKISVYFFNSMLIGIVTTLFVILVGSMAAFALVRGPIQKRAKNAFGVWFLIQKMYPAIATAIPVYLIMRKLRLMDTPMALIIMNTSFNLPLVIWLMMGFLEQIPYSLEESAVLDGCSFTGRFFMIVLPITKPGLIASAILTFVATWNEFLFAVILSIKRAKTLPVIIAGFITDRGLAWGPMAATAVLCLLPVIILTLAVQKDFVNGLAMGAVKG
ncbi:carbohydrate ABC transporter permease [Treponema maltophilum]|jgi:ABC-type sugar transport system, permease component|uniref:carbohydrate ABC transporter permease n=1 Tax=Treponema maltophilum TaxID=51160 RepID=UPI003D8B0AE3